MDFITQSQSDPFFLMLSLNPPHSDFTDPPEDKRALYPGESSLSHRGNFVPGVRDGKYEGDWPKYQGYHAHVSAIDDELGRIMQQLDALGLADNTILVYSSDHGSMCGSHGLGNKRHPYEESIKTPFIVRWPKAMPAGQTTDSLFGTIDIMPSLCALAGLAIPDECQGQNFSPTMLGQTGPSPESQFLMHIYFKKAEERESSDAPYFRGVITDRYTYTVRKKGPWQLFDNLKDPYQLNNLIDDPGLSAERSKMKNMVAAWLQQAGDPFVLPGD